MRTDFLRFSNNAISPTKGSADAAGNDLYLTEEALVPPSSASFECLLHARSSFAMQFTNVGDGVIDSDYRGPVVVVFLKFFKQAF